MSSVERQLEDRSAGETLVVELVTEELPPKALKALGASFADTLSIELQRRGLLTERSAVTSFATPRRLAVAISHVAGVAPDKTAVDKLMPAKVARDGDGQPSEALRRKLAALDRPQLASASLAASDGPDRLYVDSDGKAYNV
jgi:glycyl-tRNA synthetase beta chain